MIISTNDVNFKSNMQAITPAEIREQQKHQWQNSYPSDTFDVNTDKNLVEDNQPEAFPPSNKKYVKNGKKVRANIGIPMATILTAGMSGSIAADSIKGIISDKASIKKIKDNIELFKLEGENLKKAEDAIELISKRIKSDKKSGIIGALLIAAATIGAIVYTNHKRNKKREQLYNEPLK